MTTLSATILAATPLPTAALASGSPAAPLPVSQNDGPLLPVAGPVVSPPNRSAGPVVSPLSRSAEPSDRDLARDALRTALSRERFYFAMTDRFANGDPGNDRGGLSGDRLTTGFDPTHKGFYQGGDLAGLIGKLDYVKNLGSTAIWITPAFENRPVQGTGANASAGYHGYWITDFTRIDPHLGTNAEMRKLVREAHRRGMKVFFDVITNHTADVIGYREQGRSYRSKGAYPYVDVRGVPFDDRDHAGGETFPKVGTGSFPYTPVTSGNVKTPSWLNDPTMYHNRGDSTFSGENDQYGDFFGLDDLWTERPEVVKGMIDIYRTWVRDTGIDGFRIDTAKHVNMEFWERFSPALRGYAAGLGNKRFFMFGEVYSGDPAFTSRYSTRGGMDATLDFPFQEAARSFSGGTAAADRLARLFAGDDHHTDADGNASSLPTFLGNHDMGRIGRFIAQDNPGAPDAELLRRDLLAHELMFLSRGQPVVYYGDEQGYTGKGGDQDARAPMFASRTDSYLSDDLIGTTATHAQDNFVPGHPIYQGIAALARLRDAHPALADGAQIERLARGGVYAFSRIGAAEQVEYVVAVNNAERAETVSVPTFSAGTAFTRVYGEAAASATTGADAKLAVTVPALSAVVYRASAKLAAPAAAPAVSVALPGAEIRGTEEDRRIPVTATVPGTGFDQVTFAARTGDGRWKVLGTDDAPTVAGQDGDSPGSRVFRVFHDLRGVPAGTKITYKAVVKDSAGRLASATATATVGADPAPEEPGAVKRDWLVVHYQRDDYAGWGLHVWGDVENPTEWDKPLPLTGEDAYGRFAWIKLKPGAADVRIIAHKGDEKDGGERIVNPTRTGEVWLAEGGATTHASRAAAQGYATVRYSRPDKAYDGWGLHLWGDGLADGVPTEWATPRPPDGVDAAGAFWKVPLKNASVPVNLIVHKGDTKDPGPDQSFTPAFQPEAHVVSGAAKVHPTRAAAENVAIVRYHRPDGNYDGWGLHLWGDVAQPTEWATPLRPAGEDAFGAYFRVPLKEDAKTVSYIIHRGDEKDLPDDQALDLTTAGHEIWRIAATAGHLLPQPAARGADADLSKSAAHWIDRATVAWKVETSPSRAYSLAFSAKGDIAYARGDLTGTFKVIRLLPGELTAAQKAKWPHLAGHAAFTVDPRDTRLVREALRGQIVAVERDASGTLLTATGVQSPGVLDDVHAGAVTAELGPSWHGGPRLSLWAPTARTVELALYRDPSGGNRTVHAMRRDDETGVWSVRGRPDWKGRYYTYLVTVYSPAAGEIVTNEVTDPYSLSLAAGSGRSHLVDLSDRELRPDGWSSQAKPRAVPQEKASVYELHVRDFSASDATVPAGRRGTYAAFTGDSAGMKELRALARDGLTHVHLLPVFDIATVPERREDRAEPGCDLASMPADSERQQECVARTAARDSFNWGYDPLHYTVPEGSYASDPEGSARIREFRGMVGALNGAGLRVVMDVVYNHTHAAGQDPTSVLDRIVPGYYHRLLDDGAVATSTCCANTAPEHAMMGRLVVDSVVTWAKQYRIDGFRFDLMGHHPKANMLAVRQALDALTPARDGVDGKSIILYGEGWNFGEVADGARFEQATQANMAGTGIGTFSDRLRDAVRGGSPFDADPRIQGFGSGLAGAPNGSPANGTAEEQRARLLGYQDLIKLGLAGNLRDYTFTASDGRRVKGSEVSYNGSPAGYAAAPGEVVTYVDAHDNETLFDALAYKLPQATTMADRVRMQSLSLATAVLAQGTSFVHAGSERLRSKSLDRNSYDSGDWFNRLLWDCSAGNGFGAGLPPKADNEDKWPYARPLLADPALRPDCAAIGAARARFGELLAIRSSSPVFGLGSLTEVQKRLTFPAAGAAETPGVVTMHLDSSGIDPRWKSVTVVLNATPEAQRQTVAALKGTRAALHPVQATGDDAVVKQSTFDPATGTLTVPARTVAVFVQP
ncbi:pullulanase-type alpha-1,6-glucosidase [Streptosporangium becharense]|uniref:1,4-alpha-D-glucan glucanohydrolase n=1 Tax=Streptosporangium becharense TaxID=1816182 RepID=A0A7W9ILP5_9ACTN|nr:pullulanase-type alpha-1,6-glucosidase [Streptosporangium becharense]MBB2910158.1 pullulanase-type alpha-1,6-glucosidase [Streptosporangium becharense]MBB5822901.1 pullulanase-type alpha-1,6-glucosidase [Streptosporangium becharense]